MEVVTSVIMKCSILEIRQELHGYFPLFCFRFFVSTNSLSESLVGRSNHGYVSIYLTDVKSEANISKKSKVLTAVLNSAHCNALVCAPQNKSLF